MIAHEELKCMTNTLARHRVDCKGAMRGCDLFFRTLRNGLKAADGFFSDPEFRVRVRLTELGSSSIRLRWLGQFSPQS